MLVFNENWSTIEAKYTVSKPSVQYINIRKLEK